MESGDNMLQEYRVTKKSILSCGEILCGNVIVYKTVTFYICKSA